MDEPVIARLLSCLLGAAALAHGAAAAQALNDPTRPPASVYMPAPDPAAPQASQEPQLQSVLIARHPGGRHVAVIDGQTVRLGESFRGARLVRMTQNEVELADGKRRRVLRLYAPMPTPQRHNERD